MEINYVIRWIVIYPVDRAIPRLNNRGQLFKTLDSAIHQIKICPVDSTIIIGFPNTSLLDIDFSVG